MIPDEPRGPESPEGPEEPRQPRALIPYQHGYSKDEIDLVEVGVNLWRRWKIMLPVFLVCIGAGLALALLTSKSYGYTTVIRLGSYTAENGTIQSVITPDSAVAALDPGFIGVALRRYIANHDIDPRKIEIEATGSEIPGAQTDSVTLSGEGPVSLANAYETVERVASDLLAKSTESQINVIRGNIQQELTQAQIKLARIQDPDVIKAETAALSQDLTGKNADLENLKQHYAVLKEKNARLQDAEKLYKQLENQLNSYLSKAREQMLASSSNATSPTQAMTALLLSNQIQQNLQLLNDIEQKLTVTLPQEIAGVQADLANNKQQQIVTQNAIEQAQAKFSNYDSEHQRNVDAQKAHIISLQTRLNNVLSTKIIVGPNQSIRPVGLRRAVIAILGAFAGVILALLAAALVNYLSAVRRRLGGPEDSAGR